MHTLIRSLLTCVVVLLLSGIYYTRAEPRDGVTIEKLLQRIDALEARVKQLEQQRLTFVAPQPADHAPVLTTPVPQTPQVPREWQKKAFNGSHYYIVPLTR